MVFSSVTFLIVFLPIVLFLYYITPKKFRNIILLLSSCVFYYIGEQSLLIMMILSCLVSFISSLLIEKYPKYKKIVIIISLIISLGLLGYFKYIDFFIGAINDIFSANIGLFNVALPIGISFYTFQNLSYVIDVYKGKVKANKNVLNYLTYITFFPQLIAGPIVRYETINKELTDRKETIEDFADGIRLFAVGLGKKVLIANTLAEFYSVYSDLSIHTTLIAWIAIISLTLQIYFDFSGYSDMAIGLGRMFGFHFTKNFDYPLISKSATEFWRRWHISLGTWFRDYVYIPLGGNRVKVLRHIFNIFVVWFLTGMWHGAAYNFILWGLYYGVLLVLEKYIYGKFLEKHKILGTIYFIFITLIGFNIFNNSTGRILELFGSTKLFSDTLSLYYIKKYLIIIFVALVGSTPLVFNIYDKYKNNNIIKLISSILCIVIIILSIAYLVDGSYNPFLYFRF